MNLRRCLVKLLPSWAVLLATDFRCLLRYAVVSRQLPLRSITQATALVVAPHPDDETFGCGGLIKLKRNAGVTVRVILLTDGEAVGSGQGEEAEKVISARRREFVNACQELGLTAEALRWLHLPDGKLPQSGQPGFHEAAEALAAEIEDFNPGEIYCPHLLDVRPDHIAATQMTHEALRLGGLVCALVYYPVWMWYHASSGLRQRLDCHGAWRLDISRGLPAKKQAMAAYLDAPKTSAGNPYCGRLPWSFLRNFRRHHEVFFPATGGSAPTGLPPVNGH